MKPGLKKELETKIIVVLSKSDPSNTDTIILNPAKTIFPHKKLLIKWMKVVKLFLSDESVKSIKMLGFTLKLVTVKKLLKKVGRDHCVICRKESLI